MRSLADEVLENVEDAAGAQPPPAKLAAIQNIKNKIRRISITKLLILFLFKFNASVLFFITITAHDRLVFTSGVGCESVFFNS